MIFGKQQHLSVLLAAPAFLFALTSAASANLLINPGFESPDASGGEVNHTDWEVSDGWTKVGSGGEHVITADVAREGDQSLRLRSPSGNNFAMVAQDVAVGAGQTLVGSLYVFNPVDVPLDDGYIMQLNFRWLDGEGNQLGADATAQMTNADFQPGEWTLVTHQATAPEGTAVMQLRITMRRPGGGGNSGDNRDLYFDDATLIPEPSGLALIGLGGLAMVRRRGRQRA